MAMALLFIIFINDITNASALAKYVLFADDLNIFLDNVDRTLLYEEANEVLKCIYNYCRANLLIVNFDKCFYMDFTKGTKNADLPIFKIGIESKSFKKVEVCKFLGVFIKSNLKWDEQIENVIKQVSKSCGSLYSIRLHVPCKVLKQVYLSLVQPYLTYCLPLWGHNFSSSIIKRLFILQKKCVRIVCNSTSKINGSFQHTKPMFFKLKLLTIFNLYNYFCGCFGMNILKYRSPSKIYKFFVISERASSNKLILPKYNSSKIMNDSFIYNSSRILNLLIDNDISYASSSPDVFKKLLKRHLINRQNSSLEGDDNWLQCNHSLFSDIVLRY